MEQPENLDRHLHDLLESHFGYSHFRPLQLEAITAVLTGQDVLLILPTGGGKSLSFQLPALARSQISVIVTPLLALAKDQVENANDFNIEAASWSSQTSETRKQALARDIIAEDGTLRLLYTTPESLQAPDGRLMDILAEALAAGRIACLAIDEAHACSQWGHDFRPSYLTLGEVRSKLPGLPCIAVTATATQQVRSSIVNILGLKNPQMLLGSFNRPEIQLNVAYKELIGDGSETAVLEEVVHFIQERPGESGIVYCRLRETCDKVSKALCNADIAAAAYHAGLDPGRRSKVQNDWKEGGYDVVVATIAFGMGIDKADVRYVVHIDPPASLEGLYQEAGRAGRDKELALSVVFASNEDLKKAKNMEKGSRSGSVAAVASYIQEPGCRRKALLAHFDEKRGACSAANGEQLCDYCQNPRAVAKRLAELEAKLQSAAAAEAAKLLEMRHGGAAAAAEADPYEHGYGDEEGRYASQLPKSALTLRPLHQNDSGVGAGPQQAQQPVMRVKIPAKRKPLLPSLSTALQVERGGPAAADTGVIAEAADATEQVAANDREKSNDDASEVAAAAPALAKKSKRAFVAPRRINTAEK